MKTIAKAFCVIACIAAILGCLLGAGWLYTSISGSGSAIQQAAAAAIGATYAVVSYGIAKLLYLIYSLIYEEK